MKQNIVVKLVFLILLSLLGFFYLLLLGGSIYEAVVFPQSPQKVTLSQVIAMDSQNKSAFLFFRKAQYVSITDAIWECASVKQVDAPRYRVDHTEGVFSNANTDTFVFVQINGLYTCQELQNMDVAGKLERSTKRPVEYESDTNGSVIKGEDSEAITFELCTHCTPPEARVFPLFFFLIPFAMGGIFAYGKCQQQNENID